EGPQDVRAELKQGPTPILPATVAHSHIESRSISGGVVYRGSRLKKLVGHYVYGDYVTGKIWAYPVDGGSGAKPIELLDAPYQVIAFGADTHDELLVVTYDGTLQRLVENKNAVKNQDFPKRLSQTGLFQSVADHRLASGVIPYSLIAEPWADGAVAQRAIAVPGTGKLEVETQNNVQHGKVRGAFKFPADTVILKTLSLPAIGTSPARRIETQLLHLDGDTWRAYSYQWNPSQTDAELVPAEGRDLELNRLGKLRANASKLESDIDSHHSDTNRIGTWHFASRINCIVCHTTRAGSIHGFKPSQLDRPHDYGKVTDNQLRTLEHVGLFDDPTPQLKKLGVRPDVIADPYAKSVDLEARARAYLHVNCAHCHLRGGGGTANFQLLHHLSLEQTGVVASRPTQGSFGIYRAEVIVPQDPYRSVLLYRMSQLGKGRMPHIGSSVVDVDGVRLMHDWIAQLAPLTAKPQADPQKTDTVISTLRKTQRLAIEQIVAGAETDSAGLSELLNDTGGGLMLLNAIDRRVTRAAQSRLASLAAKHSNDAVRGLFERFLPHDQRQKRLGTTIDAVDLLAKPGNIDRGRALFATATGMQCRNCHKAEKIGKDLGPGLDQIGKRLSRPQLLESILDPSKKIEEKYRAYVVETVKGRVFTGLMMSSTDSEVVLKDSAGKELRLKRADVETLAPQLKSLMPDLLARDMTAQQVADLLAYLSSLK
ncbi:MAG: c-type cytochrome, partial [Planctomycetota bacterium]|nr:c-type cytochrome [Planctomycetota bacterium]